MVFGHIHEGNGIMMLDKTILVNAAHMDEYYQNKNGFKVIYL
jgi:Icc-related predicted phosphoesterase